MGKKKCVSSYSSSCSCPKCVSKCSSSSSSSCYSSSSSSCYSSSSSTKCCIRYPKCESKCKYICSPSYYPNNIIAHNPCLPNYCKPPQQCLPIYTVNPNFNQLSLYTTTPTVNLYVNLSDSSGNIILPPIATLNNCNYNKIFVLSNIVDQVYNNNYLTVICAQNSTDKFSSGQALILSYGETITLYSTFVQNQGIWIVLEG